MTTRPTLLEVRHLGGRCPVQAEGELDGHRFFFRARGARWRLWVAHRPGPGGDPLARDAWLHEEPFGEWPDAGHMDEATAQSLLERAAAAWRQRSMAQSEAPAT